VNGDVHRRLAAFGMAEASQTGLEIANTERFISLWEVRVLFLAMP
jgi:hypothetical protein